MAQAPLPDPNQPINDPGDLSPTSIVLNFLKSKGAPLNGASIRTALEQNAREPGYIPDLGNNAPSTEAQDQAAMAAARGGSRGGGSRPNPFANPTNISMQNTLPPPGSGAQTTSAQPTGATSAADVGADQGSNLGLPAGLGALVASGLGLWGASRLGGRGAPPQMNAIPGGMPPPAAAPPMTPNGEIDYTQLGSGEPLPSRPAATPMEVAMQKAIAPAGQEVPPLTGVRPYQPMAPGVNPVDPDITDAARLGRTTPDPAVVNEAQIASGAKPPPDVPFTPRAGRIPNAPGNMVTPISPLRAPAIAARSAPSIADFLKLLRIH